MTPRLAEIVARMVEAKLAAETRLTPAPPGYVRRHHRRSATVPTGYVRSGYRVAPAGSRRHRSRSARLLAPTGCARFQLSRGFAGPLPYLWTAEWHPQGHGQHVHFAVGRYIQREWIENDWGHGFVHIKLLGDLPQGSGVLGEARLAARYLAKYLSKDLDARPAGLHRYDVARGFQPERLALTGRSADEVLDQAATVMGREPAVVWRSSDMERWQRPAAVWAQWNG